MINRLTQYEYLSLQQEERSFWLSLILGIVAFVSVLLFYIDYRYRKNKERAEKSIKIAEQFAKEIIDPLSFIYAIFEKYGIDKLILKAKFTEFEDFDIDELNTIYSSEDINSYKELISKCNSELKGLRISNIINVTLNNLEHMCMNIVTKVADEKYIYNSLHQQFIRVINLLYIHISLTNIDNKNKYYTNIIYVYNIWKNKYIKAEEKEKKLKKKMKPRISKIN